MERKERWSFRFASLLNKQPIAEGCLLTECEAVAYAQQKARCTKTPVEYWLTGYPNEAAYVNPSAQEDT